MNKYTEPLSANFHCPSPAPPFGGFPLPMRALKKMPIFGKTNENAVSFYTCELFSDIQILSSF